MVKMISRRTWLGMATGMTAVVLGLAATQSGNAFADTLDDMKKEGTIKVGVGVMGTKPWVYQNEDGSVTIPDVLVPYMGGQKRIEPRA